MTEERHVDLSPHSFPFTMLALNAVTNDVLWRREVTGPGRIHIPPLAKQIGAPVRIKMLWPDGTVSWQEPL